MNNLFEYDKILKGAIIGTDEAGRGPGAGGVFAAAVFFPNINEELILSLDKINDSKKLSAKRREELFEIIKTNSFFSIVCIEVEEIEKINILNSSLKAMRIACNNVAAQIIEKSAYTKQDINVLVDGNRLIKEFAYNQQYVVKGDSKSASIAAASILAKVSRDRYMKELHKEYPVYNWEKNAGYLTKEHLCAIDKYGLSPYHRISFLKKHNAKQLSLLN